MSKVTTSIPPQQRIYPDPACTVPNYCKLSDQEKANLNAEIRRTVDRYRTVYIEGLPEEYATPNPDDCNEKIIVPEPQVSTYQLNSVICPVSATANAEAGQPPATAIECGANCYPLNRTSPDSTGALVTGEGYHVVADMPVDVVRISDGAVLQSVVYRFDTRIRPSSNQTGFGSNVGIRAPLTVSPHVNQAFGGTGTLPCTESGSGLEPLAFPTFVPRIQISTYTVVSGSTHRTDFILPYHVPCATTSLVGLTSGQYRYSVRGLTNLQFIPVGTQKQTCELPGYNTSQRYNLSISLYSNVVVVGEVERDYIEGVDDPFEFTGSFTTFQNRTHFGEFGGVRYVPSGDPNDPWLLQFFAKPSANAPPEWIDVFEFEHVSRLVVHNVADLDQALTKPTPVELGNPNTVSCTGGSFSQSGSSSSAIVYRNNELIDSSWSGSGALNLPRGTGTVTVMSAYPAVYHTPILTSGSISNIKRMKHAYVHFYNDPEAPQPNDANVAVITDYGYDDFQATDIYALNSDLTDLSLSDKENVPYLNAKVALQGSAYGYQLGVWSLDERVWSIDGYQFEFDAYNEYAQKHRRE
jgi:hypothetical protein